MRSRGVPEGQGERAIEDRDDSLRKIDNFLPSRLAVWYCFSEIADKPGSDFESDGTDFKSCVTRPIGRFGTPDRYPQASS